MSQDNLQRLWDTQHSHLPHDVDDEMVRRVLQRFHATARGERRLALLFGILAVVCYLWIVFWIVLFAIEGADRLRQADMFPPLSFAFVIPAYVGAICTMVVVSYLRRRREYTRLITSGGFRQQLEAARIQTRARIAIWQSVPIVFGIGILVGAIGLFISPEFNPLQGKPLVLVVAAFLPDLCILACLHFWTRSVVRRRHRPRFDELDSLLSELRDVDE